MRRHFHRGRDVVSDRAAGERRETQICAIQRSFQGASPLVSALEKRSRRTDRRRGSAPSVQQYGQSFDDSRDSKGFQEGRGAGRSQPSLFHAFASAHLRLSSLQGKQVESQARPETAWTFEHRHNAGLRGRDGTRTAPGFGKTLWVNSESRWELNKAGRGDARSRTDQATWLTPGTRSGKTLLRTREREQRGRSGQEPRDRRATNDEKKQRKTGIRAVGRGGRACCHRCPVVRASDV
jgi:hypothetical protein